MKRILILGCSGAGKTTLARDLGDRLDLPVYHLDALLWKSGWELTVGEESCQIQREVVARESWIIDGIYGATLDIRLPRADTIIFLDFPRLLCLWRVVSRWLKYRGVTRPHMTPGCPEKIDWEFFCWIWSFPERNRPRVLEAVLPLDGDKRVIFLNDPREVRLFLEKVGREQ